MTNLWPDDIFQPASIRVPTNILREQASLLGDKTRNLIKGEIIEDTTAVSDYRFNYDFYIFAPTLNYRYLLCSILYDIDLYPLRLITEKDILEEVLASNYKPNMKGIRISTEEELLGVLSKIFNSKRTRKIIGALLRMVEPSPSPSPSPSPPDEDAPL